MVCTLLAGVNVVAFAADEDASTSTSVYRSYNPNNGEHLMTIDSSEYAATVAAGYSGEGEAWRAPVVSSTEVWRAYNPNSGEHMLAPQGEVEALAAAGWQNEGLKMYSDDEQGVPIYRVFNPNATDAGSHHYCGKEEAAGLVAMGWQWDNNQQPVIYGVGQDVSDVVSIIDKNGLQEDGTGIVGDTLLVVFGSQLGVPSKVIWYKNGAVVKVSGDQGIDVGDLSLNTGADNLKVGNYYAQIENTAGKVYKTNSIAITDEGTAVIVESKVADNYDALATWAADLQDAKDNGTVDKQLTVAAAIPTDYDAMTHNAVIDVTLNKAYEKGKFYLVSTDSSKVGAALATYDADVKNNTAVFNKVKEKEFNNTYLYNGDNRPTSTGAGVYTDFGIYYQEDSGVTHYKWVPGYKNNAAANGGLLERGKEYAVVYTDKTWDPNWEFEDLDTVATFTVPYLMAPTSLEVTDRQSKVTTPGWSATLNLMGVQAAWVSETAVGISKAQALDPTGLKAGITLYENASISNEGGKAFAPLNGMLAQGNAVLAGQAQCVNPAGPAIVKMAGTDANNKAVYAKFVGPKEIFGQKVELTSAPAETAIDPMTSFEMSENEDEATAADVEFEGLSKRASGTVYILKGNDATESTFDKIKDKDLSKAVASEHVDGGTQTVTIEDVFDSSDLTNNGKAKNNNKFVAVFVPDDTDLYSTMYAGKNATEVYTLEQVATTYSVTGKTKNITVKTGSAVEADMNTGATLVVKDQFGTDMDATVAIGNAAVNAAFVAPNGVFNEYAKAAQEATPTKNSANFSICSVVGGKVKPGYNIYFGGVGATTFVKNGDFYYKLDDGAYLVFSCTKDGGNGVATFDISISPIAPQ